MPTKKDYTIPTPKQQPFLNNHLKMSIMSNGLASTRSSFHSTTSSLPSGDDTTLLDHPFSSSVKFNTSGSPDSDIQANIVLPQPK
jgi:hypothetical protein